VSVWADGGGEPMVVDPTVVVSAQQGGAVHICGAAVGVVADVVGDSASGWWDHETEHTQCGPLTGWLKAETR
jgi:hypothetical protein